MKEIILLKSGELALKGKNRCIFEDIAIKNAKHSIKSVGEFKFYKSQSTMYAEPLEDCDLDLALEKLSKVFGFSKIVRAKIVDKDFDAIKKDAVEYLREDLLGASTFKVIAKRSDKSFPMNSPQICMDLGEHICGEFPHLKVDVNNPEINVEVEIRDFAAYIHTQQLPGAGGIPVGTGGRAALLLSGGIDSPVAGYMMAKRGIKVMAVHFASPPYTSQRAEMKVHSLCEKLVPYTTGIRLFTVPFTEIQEQMQKLCNEDYFTLVMRRIMMKIASEIAEKQRCHALITGECLGQVASQTIEAIASTDDASSLPVLRPLIGFDKEDIVDIARKIDTFETSILPYDDCCTVFTPRRPKTKPRISDVVREEQKLDLENLIQRAVDGTEIKLIGTAD